MKKKFLALVLTLAMVLSLVPVTALATNGTPTPDKATESVTKSQDGVNITKKVVTDKEGNHNLVMEAYVEGTTTETTTSTPLDIVLVLDVSGSMDNSQGWGTAKKIESLKSAVNNFIAEVAKKNTDTDGNTVGHRISIVKFAGKKATEEGNDTYRENGYTYNYSQIVKNLTTVDATGKNELTAAVNGLRPAGATRADYGMELAQSVLPSNEDSNRDKVVVMFTDGTPTSGDTFENKVASAAISASKALKDKEVKVYTVGIFNNANPKADVNSIWTYRENKYMHAVSSNYPGATFQKESGIYNWSFGERAQGSNYYLSATDADGLNKVFQEISDSITHTTVTADENAVLRDTLTDQFVLNGNANDITVQTAAVTGTGKNADGKYIWAEPENVTTGITKNVSGKTVTVTGFNYTSPDNVITEKSGIYSGHKLIVTIPIKVNEAYEGWEAGTKNYDTNVISTEEKQAGLTGYTKGTDTNASTLLDRSPQVPVTAYTVKYDWGTSAPAGANIPTNSNTYLTGKTYPVDTTYATDKEIKDSDGRTWHFSGWTDPNNGVMGTKNVTITGFWKYTEPTPPDPTYTLTYDANGGKFGSDSTKTETIDQTGDHALNYTSDYTPTYTNHIFLGWSAEKLNVLDSASNAAENAKKIITSVNVTDNGATVYAVWGLDEDGNNIPDVFEATIIYKIVNGQWTKDGKAIGSADITATFQLYEQQADHTWKATNKLLRDGSFPAGYTGKEGYTGLGWYRNSETTPSPSELVRPTTKVIDAVTDAVTGAVTGAETVFTYKYAPTTPKTYTVVLHLEGGSYTTTPDIYTENSDGIYQYNVTKTDAVINPESPSRNNFGFTGWSLSKNAPQTLIGEDANFASLYLEQSGTSGSFDKIDLYAVWKESESPTPADPVEWDVSCSKIASGLMKNSNGDWTTDVTLSIPSSEKQLVSDVLFILDESSCSESVKASVNSMLDALYEQIENSGAKIKVGAVQFRGNVTTLPLTELTENTKTEITSFMSSRPEVGGTNMSAGLLKAQKMLDDDTSVMDGRKYVILVSDGITYIWDDETTDAQENLGVNFANADAPNNAMLAGPDGWDVKYGESYIPENWESHFNGINSMMSTTIQNKASNYERGDNATIGKPFVAYGEKEQYTSTVDIALYKSYNAYKALQEKYNTYAVCSGVEKDMTDFPFGPSFMTYLADGKNVTFNSIQNDILYAVSAGSTVTDTIGEKFTFGGVDSFTLTVGNNKITGTVDGNTVNFGNVKQDKSYPYTVTYTPDTKTFVWTINENVSNFAPVQLTYTVKLTKPETASATYGQTDLDGDTFIDDTQTKVDTGKALYTNQSATLVPMNSAGKLGQPLLFPKPSVSYTIKGSSGGHGGNGGGTVTIPDDVPTGLNGKDHYAYVVGYPDGMVYPQKNITRAEVATIFFRLLTDETREANMTKSNSYNDMKDGAWYTCAVSTLSKMGIIKGYEDGSFKPDASISRAEFAAIAARFDPDGDKTPATFSDVSSHWAKDEISIAANHGWIKGYEDGSFKPDQKITRAETMTLVNRVLKRLPETKDDLHKDMKTWPDNQNESAWFYLAVQEATNSHYQKLKKDGTHETWESMRETRDWAALEK